MGLTNAFRDLFVTAVTGTVPTYYNNANAYIGVGDSATAFANTQTDLQASTNKLRKAMDATYPTVASPVLTFRATFGATDAVWVWNEQAVFNAAAAGTMMSRTVGNLGTKPSGPVWIITYTVTFSV